MTTKEEQEAPPPAVRVDRWGESPSNPTSTSTTTSSRRNSDGRPIDNNNNNNNNQQQQVDHHQRQQQRTTNPRDGEEEEEEDAVDQDTGNDNDDDKSFQMDTANAAADDDNDDIIRQKKKMDRWGEGSSSSNNNQSLVTTSAAATVSGHPPPPPPPTQPGNSSNHPDDQGGGGDDDARRRKREIRREAMDLSNRSSRNHAEDEKIHARRVTGAQTAPLTGGSEEGDIVVNVALDASAASDMKPTMPRRQETTTTIISNSNLSSTTTKEGAPPRSGGAAQLQVAAATIPGAFHQEGVGGSCSSHGNENIMMNQSSMQSAPTGNENGGEDYDDNNNELIDLAEMIANHHHQQQQHGASDTTAAAEGHASSGVFRDSHCTLTTVNTAALTSSITSNVILEAVAVSPETVMERHLVEQEIRRQILQEAVQPDHVVVVPATTNHHQQEGLDGDDNNNYVQGMMLNISMMDEDGYLPDPPRPTTLDHQDPGTRHPESSSSSSPKQRQRRRNLARLLALVIVVIILVVGLAIGLSSSSSSSGHNNNSLSGGTSSRPKLMTQLERIQKRGYIRCGIYTDQPGFGYKDRKTGAYSGFNFQLCRAVSAAIFGDGDKYEIVTTDAGTRFATLAAANRDNLNDTTTTSNMDLVSQSVTATMERDIAEQSTGIGFTFTNPFYYSGTSFGGVPEFVQCADRLDPFHGHCRGLKVCVTIGTTQENVVNELLPGPVAVRYERPTDAIRYMNDGTCNVMAAERYQMHAGRLRTFVGLFYNITFELGNKTFSRDPISLLTIDGEPEWSQLVNSVIKILFTAEAMNITKDKAQQYEFNKDVPDALQERIRNIISTVGNYGELFEAEAQGVVSRIGANRLNKNFDTGLMYSHPLGTLNRNPPEAASTSPTMEQIHARGQLRCGVANSSMAPGFAWLNATDRQWSGLHIEICRGLAAALFQGDQSKVEFVLQEEGFQALQDGLVDILAGESVTLTNEFFEPTTGNSYSFSTPYFYEMSSNATTSSPTAFALATTQQDDLWNSFVYWTVNALMYAEERNITFINAVEMPIMNLFGFRYVQALRDCISAIGNYGNVYNRTLGSIVPRQGGNLQNKYPYGPQQVAFPLY